MPSQLNVVAVKQEGMKITAYDGARSIQMDYPAGPDAAGFTPLQILLASLAGCSGNSVSILLQKMKQPVKGLEVRAIGQRREQHPTVITDITLEFVVRGVDVDPAAVEKAIKQSEDLICPVWAMLKPGTAIHATYKMAGE